MAWAVAWAVVWAAVPAGADPSARAVWAALFWLLSRVAGRWLWAPSAGVWEAPLRGPPSAPAASSAPGTGPLRDGAVALWALAVWAVALWAVALWAFCASRFWAPVSEAGASALRPLAVA